MVTLQLLRKVERMPSRAHLEFLLRKKSPLTPESLSQAANQRVISRPVNSNGRTAAPYLGKWGLNSTDKWYTIIQYKTLVE